MEAIMEFSYKDLLKKFAKQDEEGKKAYRGWFRVVEKFKDEKVQILGEYLEANDYSTSAKYTVAVTLVILDYVMNEILLKLYVDLVSKPLASYIHDKVRVSDSNPKFKMLRIAKNCILDRVALSQAMLSGGLGVVASLTEESSKWAAKEMGILKEYTSVFVAFESLLHSKVILREVMNNLPFSYNKQASVNLLNRLFRIIGNIDPFFDNLSRYSIKDLLNIKIMVTPKKVSTVKALIVTRWLTSTLLHTSLSFLHEKGFHRSAILFHLVWNTLVVLILSCIHR